MVSVKEGELKRRHCTDTGSLVGPQPVDLSSSNQAGQIKMPQQRCNELRDSQGLFRHGSEWTGTNCFDYEV